LPYVSGRDWDQFKVCPSQGTGDSYTVGVLCQSNYGRTYDFQVGGVLVGKLLLKEKFLEEKNKVPTGKADDGSIVIILM
jgi:D-aminopeptidase